MKADKVFFSAPISMDWGIVYNFMETLAAKNLTPVYWNRSAVYDESKFNECGTIVFLLPGNRTSGSNVNIPVGMRRELHEAWLQQKDIYIGEIIDGNYHFYEAHVEFHGHSFSIRTNGLTCNSIYNNIKRKLEKQHKKSARGLEKIVTNSIYGGCGGINPNALELPIACNIHASTIPVPERYSKGVIGVSGAPGVMGEDGCDYDVRLLLAL
jgi:hypothetical protein